MIRNTLAIAWKEFQILFKSLLKKLGFVSQSRLKRAH